MLGYITTDKRELKLREYDLYRAYYCGVCKSIARRYGQLPRMLLSYDAAFLALLLDSLNQKTEDVRSERCITHPIKPHLVVNNNNAVDYAADMMIILAYHKLKDDMKDEHSIVASAGRLLLEGAYRSLKDKYPSIVTEVENSITKLDELEKSSSPSLDMAASAFAGATRAVFSGYVEDEEQKRVLSELGENVGRWVYIADALDDFSKDVEKGNYNPLIFRPEGNKNVQESAYEYLAKISAIIDLLDIRKNMGIIDNIVMLGMRKQTDRVSGGAEHDKRSI